MVSLYRGFRPLTFLFPLQSSPYKSLYILYSLANYFPPFCDKITIASTLSISADKIIIASTLLTIDIIISRYLNLGMVFRGVPSTVIL